MHGNARSRYWMRSFEAILNLSFFTATPKIDHTRAKKKGRNQSSIILNVRRKNITVGKKKSRKIEDRNETKLESIDRRIIRRRYRYTWADSSIRLGAGGTIPGEISAARNTQLALSPRGELCFPFQSVRCIFFSFHLQTIDAVITGWAPEAEKIFARSRSDNPTLPSPDLPCFLIPPAVPPPPPPDRSVATGVGPRFARQDERRIGGEQWDDEFRPEVRGRKK